MKVKSVNRACTRQALDAANKKGALIMAMSDAHAREIATDLKQRGYVATRCGHFVHTDATFQTARRASKVR